MNDRLKGLDSIRFVCALWVALNHVGFFNRAASPLPHFFQAAIGVLVNGPAAVIAFFVISGFCIHYPFRHGGSPFVPEYFCRRFIRIGIPMVIAMVLVNRLHSWLPDWSL